MEIRLKEIRTRNGMTQAELAAILSVKLPTYRTWERGTTMMNLEQAYNCAIALNCTIDEIAGRPPRPRVFADPDQQQLNEQYEELNATGRRKAAGSVEDIHANPANLKSEQPGRQPVPGDPRRETKSA